jgi:hypothetical protein
MCYDYSPKHKDHYTSLPTYSNLGISTATVSSIKAYSSYHGLSTAMQPLIKTSDGKIYMGYCIKHHSPLSCFRHSLII